MYINGILSFHEETIRGHERNNLICNTAAAKNIGLAEALGEVVETTIGKVAEFRSVLAPYKELLRYADSFIVSYVGFHFNETWRYRLD